MSAAEAGGGRHDGAKTPPLSKIVFVSYGTFGCNSGIHIAGFAGALAAKGYSVCVCGAEPVAEAYNAGVPAFEFFSVDSLSRDPEAIIGFDGRFVPRETIFVCWTPRELVRRAVAPIVGRFGIPYVVHLEDNEEHLTQVHLSQRKRSVWRRRPIPAALADPAKLKGFLGEAAGLTVIEERLKEILPPRPPSLVLEPGVELDIFGSDMAPLRRATIRRAVGVPLGGTMLVYPGNVHEANAEEVWQLYRAIALLRDRGRDVTLVRTGEDHLPEPGAARRFSSQEGVVALGSVDRGFLIDLLKSADILVQPGRPGPFNDYRLPSKLPEFMAAGKPIALPATNVGLRLRPGEDALLLHEGSAGEIAGHVETIESSPPLAARLGRNARAFAERHYRWDAQAEKLEAFLRLAAARSDGVPPAKRRTAER
ncbi:MAG: glycosyltransferase family 4 protein [Propylenella sp.]